MDVQITIEMAKETRRKPLLGNILSDLHSNQVSYFPFSKAALLSLAFSQVWPPILPIAKEPSTIAECLQTITNYKSNYQL